MSLLSDKILEDINKMNPIDKRDFMEDYCEKYNCSETDRSEELKDREDILVIAIKMLTDKNIMGEFQSYIANHAEKWFVDDLLVELEALCKEDYRFE
jgi:hypothetical protein